MPEPNRRLATWAPRVSIPASLALSQFPTAHIGRAWRCLWKACRSVAEGSGLQAGVCERAVVQWR